jgi:type II secretory pathway pseudopilin PulG
MLRKRKAFTLMDVLVATAVTGLGVASTICAVGETTMSSVDTREQVAAVNLAQQVHEFALSLPHSNPDGTVGLPASSDPTTFNDIYDLNNWQSATVISSSGQAIDGYAEWQQVVRVYGVDANSPQTNLAAPTRMGLKRLVVTVLRRGTPVHSESWFLAPTPK